MSFQKKLIIIFITKFFPNLNTFRYVKESIEFNLLSGLNNLEKEINKFDKLNNAQKSNLVAKIEKLVQLLDSQ